MRLRTSSIVLSTIVASFGSLSLASSGFHQRSSLQFLSLRQASSTCQSICTTAQNVVKPCKTDMCLCTVSNAAGLQSCVTCVIQNESNLASSVSAVLRVLNTFNTDCVNFPNVPSLTLPGPSTSTTQGTSHTSSTSVTTSQTQSSSSPTSSTTAAVSTSAPVLVTSISTETVEATSTAADSSTSTAGGLPLGASAIRNEMFLHGIGPLFGLVLGIAMLGF